MGPIVAKIRGIYDELKDSKQILNAKVIRQDC